MEDSISPERSPATGAEQNQDPLDISSQATAAEEKEEPSNEDTEKQEEAEKSVKVASEFRKTWGFRRTTIAKREMPGDADSQESRNAPVRRSGRQAKRTDKLEEFLSTAKRGRGGRRSAPAHLEPSDPPSQTPTDAETASEASFDGNAEVKAGDGRKAPERVKGGAKKRAQKPKGGSVSDEGSSENEDEENGREEKPTPKEEEQKSQEGGKEEVPEAEQGAVKKEEEEKNEEEEEEKKPAAEPKPASSSPARAGAKDSTPAKKKPKPKSAGKSCEDNKGDDEEDDDDDEDDDESSGKSDNEGYDPNALYCICRQKHNKRFMICCDRCEEWFHGDCVGITEARGRLLERNGEDYICPNCTLQKSRSASPASASENEKRPVRKAEQSSLAEQTAPPAGGEDKLGEDLGIKGRIEKATNPSGKKKIKIFQPAVEATATVTALPKCIGPGCGRNALPDSVYCGNDCILRHAAAAMKSITDVKETKPKEKSKPKAQKKPATRSTAKKRAVPERKAGRRSTESSGQAEEEDSDSEEEEQVEQEPPIASWSSDHNYNAVTPEKTAPIASSVFNKSSVKDSEEDEDEDEEPAAVRKQSPVSSPPPKSSKKSPLVTKTLTKGKKHALPPTNRGRASKKPLPPSKPKKTSSALPHLPTAAPSPAGPPAARHHITGALRVSKTTFTIPKKQSQPQPQPPASGLSTTSKPPPVSSTPPTSSTSAPPRPPQPAPVVAPQPQPNNQIRQNIRRSLTDILYKRVSDSDDLAISESEVGKLAVNIEKEMFNLFLNTDNKYKNKYRSIMFNLKDPKNKGLFYRVVGGEVTPFKLVRLSPEELLSKEISEWRQRETPEVMEPSPRAPPGQVKPGQKQESAPDVDMEESPPLSDGDVCIPATSPSPGMASAADQEESRPSPAPAPAPATTPAVKASQVSVASPVPDIFSSMLKDTTAEHRAHLFDLNCKICTGQKSADDEPAPKKPKLSASAATKKAEPKVKQDPRPAKAGASSTEGTPAAPPGGETPVSESPASPEDTSMVATSSQSFTPVTIPAVSSVSITRRDPRTAGYRPPVTVTPAPPATSSTSEPSVMETKVALPPPPPPPPSAPKSILLKPASSPDTRFFSTSGTSVAESHSPQDSETAMFLSGQEMMWKGFINMHTVAKFVTKAYLVSGSFEHLKEDLPDTIHIGGRISPHTVWDYVGKLKTSLSKELCLIRFHPATEEEEVAYISLFSYFSSRRRFGVVANNNRRIKDLYLIPLSAKDPLPSKLLPFDGPGLEPARPNLLLGLVICQKERKRSAAPQEGDEKRAKLQAREADDTGLPKPLSLPRPDVKQEKAHLYNPEAAMSTTPPGSPPPLGSSEPSTGSLVTPSVLSLVSSMKTPAASSAGKDSPSSSTSVPTSSASPLQTILKTLFGKKKQDSEASLSPSEHASSETTAPPVQLLDPIVQQFGQISKEKAMEEDEDDRPYDPEEEYDPAMGYGAEAPISTRKAFEAGKPSEAADAATNADVDDVAYDPEDETIFEEVKVGVGGSEAKAKVSSENEGGASTLTEQQRMLDELNKQIEEQKRQLEEQEESIRQQRAAVGVSIADALLVPPTKSLLANSQLLQLGKKVEELVGKTPAAPVINQRRDPRQSRDPRQAAANRRLTTDSLEKEETTAGASAHMGTAMLHFLQRFLEFPRTQHRATPTRQILSLLSCRAWECRTQIMPPLRTYHLLSSPHLGLHPCRECPLSRRLLLCRVRVTSPSTEIRPTLGRLLLTPPIRINGEHLSSSLMPPEGPRLNPSWDQGLPLRSSLWVKGALRLRCLMVPWLPCPPSTWGREAHLLHSSWRVMAPNPQLLMDRMVHSSQGSMDPHLRLIFLGLEVPLHLLLDHPLVILITEHLHHHTFLDQEGPHLHISLETMGLRSPYWTHLEGLMTSSMTTVAGPISRGWSNTKARRHHTCTEKTSHHHKLLPTGLHPTTSLMDEEVVVKWGRNVSPLPISLEDQGGHPRTLTIRGCLHLHIEGPLKISEALTLQTSQDREGLLHRTLGAHGPTCPPLTSQRVGEGSHDSILIVMHRREDHCGTLVLCSPHPPRVPFRSQTAWGIAPTPTVKTTGGMALT
ncbi:hypothetical protein MATL_G00074950 [Megalops atlanticus]|uniref:Death-inducer obliterator 1 n=1 Tax=Megalops atlanticus TaxID=7932 RepID=A0A9D3Q5Z3_MEGAT|nr:hypothetical protein MATL_G00074950 [Megalops atlanticus]